jgi:hypothetical protein
MIAVLRAGGAVYESLRILPGSHALFLFSIAISKLSPAQAISVEWRSDAVAVGRTLSISAVSGFVPE